MRRSRFRRGRSPRSRLAWGSSYAYTCPATTFTWTTTACADVHIVNRFWAQVPAGVFDSQLGDYQEVDLTLLRSLISYASAVRSTNAAVSDLLVTHSAGLIVWDGTSDVLPGVLDIPYPSIEGGFDWIWRVAQPDSFTATAGVQFALAENFPYIERDGESKAKRKLSAGAGLLFVMDTWLQMTNTGPSVGVSVLQSINGRFLFKLP